MVVRIFATICCPATQSISHTFVLLWWVGVWRPVPQLRFFVTIPPSPLLGGCVCCFRFAVLHDGVPISPRGATGCQRSRRSTSSASGQPFSSLWISEALLLVNACLSSSRLGSEERRSKWLYCSFFLWSRNSASHDAAPRVSSLLRYLKHLSQASNLCFVFFFYRAHFF